MNNRIQIGAFLITMAILIIGLTIHLINSSIELDKVKGENIELRTQIFELNNQLEREINGK
jgi:hypothetical protein